MRRAARMTAAACATALALASTPTLPALATPSDRATGTAVTSLTFIEALVAIPDARRAVTAKRVKARDARARLDVAQADRRAADAAFATARAIQHETGLVLNLAQRAAAASEEAMVDVARIMYVSGGTVPRLAEVLMTADSALGLTRSLSTRQYLASVGTSVVLADARADSAYARAVTVANDALARRDQAADAAVAAQADATAAARELRAAQAAADQARAYYRTLMRVTRADRSADYGRIKRCGDWLTRLLSRSGFEGENLREAWAVVMRESGGRADAVSATDDLGLFQLNTDTWQDEEWFDRDLLLTKRYNAQVSRRLSRGGRTWYSWGLDGHGRPDARAYVKAGWSAERIESHIVVPYVYWYAQYPCRPWYEKDVTPDLPVPGDDAAGAGVLPP